MKFYEMKVTQRYTYLPHLDAQLTLCDLLSYKQVSSNDKLSKPSIFMGRETPISIQSRGFRFKHVTSILCTTTSDMPLYFHCIFLLIKMVTNFTSNFPLYLSLVNRGFDNSSQVQLYYGIFSIVANFSTT